ncbi:MAG: helix-turn-helix transcriptional regulator [Slackia sp.]|nr:helix-turn-helix transcriptional regulator [Slackia sp.]
MQDTTLGAKIAELRKSRGMTQRDLAQKMHVTDKAVSKWERNASRPDIDSITLLAETLGTPVEELLQCANTAASKNTDSIARTLRTVLKSVSLAMGVATVALSSLGMLDAHDGIMFLGIGLTCIGLVALSHAGE